MLELPLLSQPTLEIAGQTISPFEAIIVRREDGAGA